MFDVKPIITELLGSIPKVTVSDVYPQDWSKTPHISFYESGNSDPLKISSSCLSDITIQIDIWHKKSTGALAAEVNAKMNSIGFRRVFAADVPDPGGIKHKTMRYRGVVDSRTNRVHQ